MVKTKVFPLSSGETGTAYYPEANDVVVSRFASVGEKEHPAIVKGKAVIIKNWYLGVTTLDGKEITLTISEGQGKALKRQGDLTGKKIQFTKYIHKVYGEKLGARVLKQ